MKSRILRDLIRFPVLSVWLFVRALQPWRWFPGRGKIVFFYQTKNNYITIKQVQAITPQSVLVHTIPRKWSPGFLFPTGLSYLISFFYLPKMVLHLYQSHGRERIAMRAYFRRFLGTYGLFFLSRIYLKLIQPQALVLTTEHARETRLLGLIAGDLGIPTFFVPHGSFSGAIFEEYPMEFDYALVMGEDSKRKIETHCSDNCKIYKIGRPSSDNTKLIQNRSSALKALGICVNVLDDMAEIERLCRQIIQNLSIQIIIRPHPSQHGALEAKKLAKELKIDISDSLLEYANDFLERVDAIVAGRSSILLDAAVMNVFPIYYDPKNSNIDRNDFVKNGLAEHIQGPDECVNLLRQLTRHKPDVRMKAKFYIDTIGTVNDGASSNLAKNIILASIEEYSASANIH